MEERRNPREGRSQSRKSANFAIEGLEMEWPCARHPLHVAHWRRQAGSEEGHLAKPAQKRPPKQTDPPGEGERQQGQKRDTHRVLARSEDNGMWNPPRFRAYRLTKGWQKLTLRTGRKNAPKSPTVGIPSLEIRSLDPDPKRVTPSWRNTDQITKEDFVAIEWEKNHTRPVGWPHREATKDRWIEEAFVLIECAEIRHTTRYGWPHRKGHRSRGTQYKNVRRWNGTILICLLWRSSTRGLKNPGWLNEFHTSLKNTRGHVGGSDEP